MRNNQNWDLQRKVLAAITCRPQYQVLYYSALFVESARFKPIHPQGDMVPRTVQVLKQGLQQVLTTISGNYFQATTSTLPRKEEHRICNSRGGVPSDDGNDLRVMVSDHWKPQTINLLRPSTKRLQG